MLNAEHPVALFANGFGDSILVLPALRALTSLFGDRLALVCPYGIGQLFFSGLPLRVLHECEMIQVPEGRVFDADQVADCLGACDLLLSLNSWHTPSVDRLLMRFSPLESVGFFPSFSVTLPRQWRRHSADSAFDIPRYLNPELRLEDFATRPVFTSRSHRRAKEIRSLVPPGIQVIVVHADTAPGKMWPADRFVTVIDIFLERHPDFVAFVVGTKDLSLDGGRLGKRVMTFYGLPLDVALALVGEADLFLGIDSCILHAADMFKVPGVGLFGPTDWAEWGFRIGPHRHICGNKDMKSISVSEVIDALESLLGEVVGAYSQENLCVSNES
jgi:hypothetical protein